MHSNEETPDGHGGATLVFHPFRLDPLEQRLWDGNDLVPLKPRAFAVLQYLVERAGRLIRREELLSGVWGDGTHLSEGVLKTQIAEIRQALRDSARVPRFIETSSRRGYRFIGHVEERRPSSHITEAPAARPPVRRASARRARPRVPAGAGQPGRRAADPLGAVRRPVRLG